MVPAQTKHPTIVDALLTMWSCVTQRRLIAHDMRVFGVRQQAAARPHVAFGIAVDCAGRLAIIRRFAGDVQPLLAAAV